MTRTWWFRPYNAQPISITIGRDSMELSWSTFLSSCKGTASHQLAPWQLPTASILIFRVIYMKGTKSSSWLSDGFSKSRKKVSVFSSFSINISISLQDKPSSFINSLDMNTLSVNRYIYIYIYIYTVLTPLCYTCKGLHGQSAKFLKLGAMVDNSGVRLGSQHLPCPKKYLNH